MALKFFLAYTDTNRGLVTEHRAIALHYLRFVQALTLTLGVHQCCWWPSGDERRRWGHRLRGEGAPKPSPWWAPRRFLFWVDLLTTFPVDGVVAAALGLRYRQDSAAAQWLGLVRWLRVVRTPLRRGVV